MVRSPWFSSLRAPLFALVMAGSMLVGGCAGPGAGTVSGPSSPTHTTAGTAPSSDASYAPVTVQQSCGKDELLLGGGWSSQFSTPEVYGSHPAGPSWTVTAASPADAPTTAQARCLAAGAGFQTIVFSAEIQVTSQTQNSSVTVRCGDPNDTALAGGFDVSRDLAISSLPVDGLGWQVTFGVAPAGQTILGRAFVLCLKARRESQIVNGPRVTLDYFRIGTSVATCPAGFEATGGGYVQSNGNAYIMENAPGKQAQDSWDVSAQRVLGNDSTIMASIYCVKF